MQNNNFNEKFFESVRESTVWNLLSDDRNFIWTEKYLDLYKDKVDWKKISANSNVQWTTPMLEKYQQQIDWDELSDSGDERLFTSENLRKFSAHWNWEKLSRNSDVNWTLEKIEAFKDKVNWEEIIDSYRLDNLYTLEFFEKYKEYIPATKFQGSNLWNALMEIHKD
ncbi:MAG: hypothetical protein LBR10_00195, partial [Prevotellaceae bacterium]|nr:hypothetical protein [Prevotellaceae bacterium]